MSPITLLPHVPIHVLKPVDPAFELDQVGSVSLDCEVDSGLSLGQVMCSGFAHPQFAFTSFITMGNLYFASAGISQRTRAQNRE